MANQSWQVKTEEAETRLDKWLADPARLGSRAKAFEAIARGKIYVNEVAQTAMEAGRKLQGGEKIRFWVDRPGSAKQRVFTDRKVEDLHIIYEDDALLVLNKPTGQLTVRLAKHPDETSLQERVTNYLQLRSKISPQVIHRLDRDTSGLVLFAKTHTAREHLKLQFIAQKPERIYRAVVYGIPFPEQANWQDWLIWDEDELVQKPSNPRDQRAVEAKCEYRVLEKFASASLLEIKLVTGKQNQIRAQAAMHGHQLIGEKQYHAVNQPLARVAFARQALHAAQLQILHPTTQRAIRFEAPLPDDLQLLLKRLRPAPGKK